MESLQRALVQLPVIPEVNFLSILLFWAFKKWHRNAAERSVPVSVSVCLLES